jgi:tryptophan-rich sensory protein
MVLAAAVLAAALLAPAAAGSSGLSPVHFSYRSRHETHFTRWAAEEQANRDRLPPPFPHPPRLAPAAMGSEVDLFVDLTKTALMLAAPLAAAWHALLAFEGLMGEAARPAQAPPAPVKRREPRPQASVYSLVHSALLLGAQLSLLFALLEYSKHYVFSIPEQLQSPAFMGLWILVALGSKLALAGADYATKLLRFPRPAVAIPEELEGRIQTPSGRLTSVWPRSIVTMSYVTELLAALQAVVVMGVWEHAGYQTSMPAILLFLAQLSLSDLWAKVNTPFSVCAFSCVIMLNVRLFFFPLLGWVGWFGFRFVQNMKDQRQFGFALFLTVPWLATAVAAAYSFYEISPSAGHIFLPSVLWALISSVITYKYWKLNGKMPLYPVKSDFPHYF